MTGYNGRGREDLNHFLTNGNAITSPSDVASQPEFDFEKSLEQFTNAQFTEFDPIELFGGEDHGAYGDGQDDPSKRQKVDGQAENKGLDFVNGFPIPANPFDFDVATATVPPQPFVPPNYNAPQNPYPSAPFPADQVSSPTSTAQSPFNPTTGSSATNSAEDNPTARAAAEEDKRRRNTAASARFRVKKKEREKAVEKEATDLKKKNQELTTKVEQLERENEWLRSFVVVRDDRKGKVEGGKEGKGDEGEERSPKKAKKGVGTPSEDKKDE